jgi:hypothetical protein
VPYIRNRYKGHQIKQTIHKHLQEGPNYINIFVGISRTRIGKCYPMEEVEFYKRKHAVIQ